MVDEQSLFGRAPSVGDEEDSEKDTQYEVVSLATLSGPLILAYTLTYLTNVVDLAMAGHLGTDELASVSLGMVVYTVWFDPLIGLSSAMQTLFTQAYGARRMGLYAQWLLVGSVVLLVAAVPTAVLLIRLGRWQVRKKVVSPQARRWLDLFISVWIRHAEHGPRHAIKVWRVNTSYAYRLPILHKLLLLLLHS